MKKIAILTLYYRNYNYGGLLQAYALQKAVESLGYEAKQISYILASGYKGWNVIKYNAKKPLAYFYHYFKYGMWTYEYNKRRRLLEKFSKKIPHTKVVTANSIERIAKDYDCFICGSDQIWNPIGWQSTLFFDFLPDDKKRISYAASVSRDSLTTEQLVYMKQYLDKFIGISVREKNTSDIINNYFTDLNVKDMPDPVFLLTQREWKKNISKQKVDEPYILAYFLGKDIENRNRAIQYAKIKHLNIRFVSYMDFKLYRWERENKNMLASVMGVEDFLEQIANAELVITDSFHAAAFSCLYETPFWAIPRFNTKDPESMNSRLQNLVVELGIQQRFTEDIMMKVDYEWSDKETRNIKINLDRLQKKGMNYLNEILKLCMSE